MSAPNARALFAAAREDGPDDVERDVVFRKIALATGVATGTAAAATARSLAPGMTAASAAAAADVATATTAAATKVAATGVSFGMKLLALGAVLGAASTALGVILAFTVASPDAPRGSGRAATTVAPATVAGGARLAEPTTRRRDANDRASAAASVTVVASANAPTATNANAPADPSSDLAEEARLVTAARNALMAGDPARALSLVQGTRKLSARSLEPEELGLEARALRALGRADDAAATELVLRRRYPDHALAR